MTDPGQRVPDPLDVAAAGVCIVYGEEQLATIELKTESRGGIRIEVTHYLECGCGRRVAS